MLGILILLVFTQTDSLACTCDLPLFNLSLDQQVKHARKQSRAIFSGRVLEVTENPQTYFVVVKFRIERLWKGNLSDEVTIITGHGGGDCGYRFEVGESYLVYAYGSDENRLGTNICQRTKKLSDAREDLRILGKGKVPRKRNA